MSAELAIATTSISTGSSDGGKSATAARPASAARIAANRANCLKSCGPRTPEGKERSRANALTHGMTGAGVVLPDDEAAEVERLARCFQAELKLEGEAGQALARRMAVSAVRMDRGFVQESASVSEQARRAYDTFEVPEGVDEEAAEELRVEAAKVALFDASKPSCLARKYEAAAERAFFRCLKEARELRKAAANDSVASAAAESAAQVRSSLRALGSFFREEPRPAPSPVATPKPAAKPAPAPSKPLPKPAPTWDFDPKGAFEVPFSIGLAR